MRRSLPSGPITADRDIKKLQLQLQSFEHSFWYKDQQLRALDIGKECPCCVELDDFVDWWMNHENLLPQPGSNPRTMHMHTMTADLQCPQLSSA